MNQKRLQTHKPTIHHTSDYQLNPKNLHYAFEGFLYSSF